MRWKTDPYWSFTNWQRWFAWRPVCIYLPDRKHQWVWWEWVERKEFGGGGWEYRLPEA